MLIVEHSAGTDFGLGPDEPSASSLRTGAALNVLSGLKAEVDLISHSEGSWLFQNVFGKQPLSVLEEALGAALEEVNDPRIDGLGGLSAEQANLALRRLAMKVQCLSPHVRPASAGGPRISDEYLRTQVWLELLRLCVDGFKDGPPAPAGKDKEKAKGEKPTPGWNDGGVLRDLAKTEPDLETDSEKMSLEALRVQNRHIEEYVMRLVRQRDELRSLTKLAEERDSYVILGLEGPESTEEEVKKAYRALARKEHPDKAGIGNKRRFQQIQQAYTSILRQIREGGGSAIARSPGAKEAENQPPGLGAPSAVVEEALAHARCAREAADRVVACAHRSIKSSEDSGEAYRDNKRRALRALRDSTKQGITDLRGAAEQLRILGEAVCGIAKCAEVAMNEQKDAGDKIVAGVGLRDKAIIVDDAGRSSTTSAELLEKISEATEATLRKVEKADSAPCGQEIPALARAKRDEASQLLHLGMRLLTESLTRTAAVARRSADEAISATIKAHELSRGLAAVDLEGRKERQRATAKQRGFDDDDEVVIAADDPTASAPESGDGDVKKDEGDDASKRTPRSKKDQPTAEPTPRDQLKSAAKRVKERHVALRVKNLRFLSTLNEESLRLQVRLREMLERSEGALLPEVSIVQKRHVFDLVSQLLDFAVSEFCRVLSSPSLLSVGPVKVLERVLSFAIALEHSKEVAMPVESRTQALKIAALIDSDLLCQIISGPLRTRLLNAACRRSRSEGASGPQIRLKSRSHSLGPTGGDANPKAWEEAINVCCSRVVACVRSLNVPNSACGDSDPN
jgi:hypothetical protein